MRCRPLGLVNLAFHLQGPFLQHNEEYGNQDQDVDAGGNHTADDGSGDGLHYIRTNARLPENWSQARPHRYDRHELRTKALDRALNRRTFQIRSCFCFISLDALVQSFVEIDDHHDAGFNGDTKQRDVPNRDSNAEVVMQQPSPEPPTTAEPLGSARIGAQPSG